MSKYKIGEKDKSGWVLVKRNGRVEMFRNLNNDYYGVYLYEHTQRDEHWILHAIRKSREEACNIFEGVADLFEESPSRILSSLP